MGSQPTGTVTFLFTDVVGSTAAWEADPQLMADALSVHDDVLRRAFGDHGGHVFATGGDGYAVAFQRAGHALAAAVAAQRGLRSAPWPEGRTLSVRMGAHTGETVERGGDYFGPAVNRAARVMDAANGGQLVITSVTEALVPELGEGLASRSLGAHRFKGLNGSIEVVEIEIDGHGDLGPLRAGGGDTHGVPDHRTSFVGRERELGELCAAVGDHRLVTVVGPGGAGKTRLVARLGRELAPDHVDGVWFVDLADVREDDAVRAAVVAALDLGGPLTEGDPLAPLARWRAVVMLDNCEQVLDGAAEVVDALLADCPGVTLIATSREALAVDGERVVHLGPLGGDDDGAEAIGLFLARARLVAPDLRPTPEEIGEITELCDALDRLPLAIELAASRADRMAVGQLAAGLLAGRAERRSRRRAGRHADLRSVLAWSTDLLDDEERAVWRRLAVFEGGFTTEAAAAVAGQPPVAPSDVAEVLDALVDRSLVVRARTTSGMRHRLLETMRMVALDELVTSDELDRTDDRHAEWVRGWSAMVREAPPPGWILDWRETDNQRRALHHLLERGQAEEAATLLADAIGQIVFAGHSDEADHLAEAIRAAAPGDPITVARLDEIDMIRAEWHGDFAGSHAAGDALRAADVDDRSWSIATALQTHHFAALDPPTALALIAESVERVGESPRTSFLRAEAAVGEARFADAVAEQLTGWDVAGVDELRRRCVGAPVDTMTLSDLAVALLVLDRTDELEILLEAMDESEIIPTLRHYVPMLRGALAAQRGDEASAVRDLAEAAAWERRTSVPILATDLCVAAAHVALGSNRPDLAVVALGVVRKTGQRTVGAFGWRRWLREQLPTHLTDVEAAALRRAGPALSPRDAVAEVLAAMQTAATEPGG